MTTMDSVKYRTLLRMLYSLCARLACLSYSKNHGIANPCALRSILLVFVFVDFVSVSSNSSLSLSNSDVKASYPFLIYFDLLHLVSFIFRTDFADVCTRSDRNPRESHSFVFTLNVKTKQYSVFEQNNKREFETLDNKTPVPSFSY